MIERTVHASAATIGGRGILIRGASGSGKSSLLLQILSTDPRGSQLVADDRVLLHAEDGRLIASPPPSLAGLLEIRGQGIRRLPSLPCVAIDLVADLRTAEDCPRMPTRDESCVELCGITLPRIFIASGAVDGNARVRAALNWPLHESA
jgi:HPr kinase/phosphorylase